MIRVLVVDDHDFVRAQLVALMDTCDGIEVVGQCSAGEQVVPAAEQVQPDVVLMDVQMGGMSGLAATEALLAVQPTVRVLILTGCQTPRVQQDAAASGARGFLLKGGNPNDVLTAVRAIAIGGTWWPPTKTGR